MQSPPDLSIVIVSYNVCDLLGPCLESVLAQKDNDLRLEVIVVDNASGDGTPEFVRQRFPDAHLIANSDNRGFPAANNQAFPLCRGRHILLLNADTEVPLGVLTALVRYMDDNPRVGLCGPRLYYPDGRFQPSAFPHPDLVWVIRSHLGMLRHGQIISPETPPQSAGYLLGACLLIRRETLGQIGPLDENLFWIEDADWCWRAHRAGWAVMYLPEIAVMHVGSASAARNIRLKIVRQHLNKVGFFDKYYPWPQRAILRVFLLVEVAAKSLIRIAGLPFHRPPDGPERLRAYGEVVRALIAGSPGSSHQ